MVSAVRFTLPAIPSAPNADSIKESVKEIESAVKFISPIVPGLFHSKWYCNYGSLVKLAK